MRWPHRAGVKTRQGLDKEGVCFRSEPVDLVRGILGGYSFDWKKKPSGDPLSLLCIQNGSGFFGSGAHGPIPGMGGGGRALAQRVTLVRVPRSRTACSALMWTRGTARDHTASVAATGRGPGARGAASRGGGAWIAVKLGHKLILVPFEWRHIKQHIPSPGTPPQTG